jgi:hypothetical protein
MLPPVEPPPAARAATRKRPRGRFAEINGFIDVTLATLTPSEVAVWLVLFRDTRAATGTARTGQEDIARRAGITSRGVRKALAGLTGKGLVKVVSRGRIGVGASVYRVRGVNPDRTG